MADYWDNVEILREIDRWQQETYKHPRQHRQRRRRLVTAIAGLLGLEPDQQAELSTATSELHQAINDPAADRGRMRRASTQ
jgi:hypothetical protein